MTTCVLLVQCLLEDAGEREDDEVRGDQEAVKTASSAAEESAFETWVGGPTVNSDEYDTDLEEDFSQGRRLPHHKHFTFCNG